MMETTTDTINVWTSRAGDPNSDIIIELPPEAVELAYEHAASEFAAALAELDRLTDGQSPRRLTVDELYNVQAELDRARRATEVLHKSRPAEEWESDDDG